MAKLLGVRTGKFSLLPKSLDTGYLQLGYVETEQTDIIRDSLIGLAPIISGTLFVAYAGVVQLRLDALWHVLSNGQTELFWLGLKLLPTVPDFFLWFYLTFAVSSTMLPSESDRHAWLELVISVGVLFAIALLVGAGPWMLDNVAPLLSGFLASVAVIFGLSSVVHVILILPTALVHKLLARATGVDVM